MAKKISKFALVSLDAGNANIKVVGEDHEAIFPHALYQIGENDIEQLTMRGELETTANLYNVNGTWYSVGEKAMRQGAGSALYGEARYQSSYYGILAAIAMYQIFDTDQRNVFLFGSHTPKDIIYRPDLIASVIGQWDVFSNGKQKSFIVTSARGFEEPIGAYRFATLADDGRSLRGDRALQVGESLVIDIGGFTVGLSVAVDGKIEYEASQTKVSGVLDVLDDFAAMIRKQYRDVLKGGNEINQLRLRSALLDGLYDAAGNGTLDVREAAKKAKEPLLREISQFYEQFGGASTYNAVLLAGGGTFLFHRDIQKTIKHPRILHADNNLNEIPKATARGGMKMLRLLESKGVLEEIARDIAGKVRKNA